MTDMLSAIANKKTGSCQKAGSFAFMSLLCSFAVLLQLLYLCLDKSHKLIDVALFKRNLELFRNLPVGNRLSSCKPHAKAYSVEQHMAISGGRVSL